MARIDDSKMDRFDIQTTEASQLIAAAERGRQDLICDLLELENNVINSVVDGTTALAQASRYGHAPCVDLLLKAGADINLPREGETPLMLALKRRNNDGCVYRLLEVDGALENYERKAGRTPLMCSAIGNYSSIAARLLRKLDCVDTKNEIHKHDLTSNTVYSYAAINGHHQFILDCLAMLYRDKHPLIELILIEEIPMMIELMRMWSIADEESHDYIVNAVDSIGLSPLMLSVALGSECLAQILLIEGACPDVVDRNGRHALIYASACGWSKCVELLIEAGTSVSWYDRKSQTALMVAAKNGKTKCVRMLIEATRAGPPHSVLNERQSESRKMKVEFGVTVRKNNYTVIRILNNGTSNGRLRIDRETRENGADWGLPRRMRYSFHDSDNKGMTALMLACINNHFQCVRLLLDAVASQESRDKYLDTELPLILTSKYGHIDIGEELIGRSDDFDINAEDIEGNTALISATREGHLEFIQLLLDHGAVATRENSRGITAIHTAASFGHPDLLTFMWTHNPPLSMKYLSLKGIPVLLAAAKNGHVKCMEILLDDLDVNVNPGDPCCYEAARLSVSRGHLKVAKLVLDRFNVMDYPISPNATRLITLACIHQVSVHLLNFLLSKGARVNIVDKRTGLTPLKMACNAGNARHTEILISNGAQLFEKSRFQSVLMHATRGGSGECVKLVLAAEVEKGVNLLDRIHRDGLFLAVRMKHYQCINSYIERSVFRWRWYNNNVCLLQYAINVRPLLLGMVSGSISPAHFMVGNTRYTPFRHALTSCDFPMAKYLLVNLYLTKDDFKRVTQDRALCDKLTNFTANAPSNRAIVDLIFTTPWSLSSLSLLVISASITARGVSGTSRQEMVDQLQVPDSFKRRMTFTERTSRICPSQWHEIAAMPWFLPGSECLLKFHPCVWDCILVPCKASCLCRGSNLMFRGP